MLLIFLGVGLELSQSQVGLMIFLNQVFGQLPDLFWACLTITGLGWSVLILISIANRHELGARLALTGFIAGSLVTHSIKPLLQHPRPGEVISPQLLHYIGAPVINHLSMPSGHSVAAFCLATLWICLLRTYQAPRYFEYLAWLLAILIALSRIAVGAHWPADVCVGAGLGILVGWIAWRLPLPWPSSTPSALPWLAIAVETTGAICALTLEEGMSIAQPWQITLGFVAILSVVHRFFVGWKR